MPAPQKILALSGGVGGAKLALGLSNVLPPAQLEIIANTGDDFEHLGLYISPDIDTIMYTLAGLSDSNRGWGVEGETWNFLSALKGLGGPDWFQLGDKDLAVHIYRSNMLNQGMSLSQATAKLQGGLGVKHKIIPMTDDPVRTLIHTDHGILGFQEYFVKKRCRPAVKKIVFDGADNARIQPELAATLDDPTLTGVIICPSNPYLSIDPILSVPGLRKKLANLATPVVAVSPIVGGQSIKGPTAKIMQELNVPVSPLSIAHRYKDFLTGIMIDESDNSLRNKLESEGLRVGVSNTVMKTNSDKNALATIILDLLF